MYEHGVVWEMRLEWPSVNGKELAILSKYVTPPSIPARVSIIDLMKSNNDEGREDPIIEAGEMDTVSGSRADPKEPHNQAILADRA